MGTGAVIQRTKARPVGAEYIEELFTDFMEFHGDRYYQDEKGDSLGGICEDFNGNAGDVCIRGRQ